MGPFVTIGSGVDGAAYQDVGLINGTTYYYIVVAANGSGNGPDSASVSAVPAAPLPGMVTGLTALPGDRNVLLTWTGVSRATSYTVKRSSTSGGPIGRNIENALASAGFIIHKVEL